MQDIHYLLMEEQDKQLQKAITLHIISTSMLQKEVQLLFQRQRVVMLNHFG